MKEIHSKDLVLKMTYKQAVDYCLKHTDYHIPDAQESEELLTEYESFWTNETLGDRRIIYNKKNQCYQRIHPNTKHHITLVKKEQT